VGGEAARAGLSAVGARLEAAETAAYESLARTAGWPVLRRGSTVCISAPFAPASTMLNRALGVGLDGRADAGLLDEVDAFFAARGIRYAVAASPHAPSGLEELLRRRGFEDGYAWAKFGRTTAHATDERTTALRVEEVSDGRELGSVIGAAYDMPAAAASGTFGPLPRTGGWHCFVAFDGETAVGAGALFVHDGVGWLGAAGTVPASRGQGAQTAILAARLAKARDLGLEHVTTETGALEPDRPSSSYRNILRAGFELLYVRPNLLAPPR
jgi:GNAT superfamily N-acetyltransferase